MAARKRSTSRKRTSRKTSKKRSSYSRKSKRSISRHVKRHKRKGMPQKQAVAAAMSEQRRKGRKVPARKRSTSKKH